METEMETEMAIRVVDLKVILAEDQVVRMETVEAKVILGAQAEMETGFLAGVMEGIQQTEEVNQVPVAAILPVEVRDTPPVEMKDILPMGTEFQGHIKCTDLLFSTKIIMLLEKLNVCVNGITVI